MLTAAVAGSATFVAMRTSRVRGRLIVSLSGILDSTTSQLMSGKLLNLVNIERPGPQGVVIDLSEVDLPEASGLASLMMAYWRVTSLDHELLLVVPDLSARAAVFTAKLNWLTPVYWTVEEAVADGARAG